MLLIFGLAVLGLGIVLFLLAMGDRSDPLIQSETEPEVAPTLSKGEAELIAGDESLTK